MVKDNKFLLTTIETLNLAKDNRFEKPKHACATCNPLLAMFRITATKWINKRNQMEKYFLEIINLLIENNTEQIYRKIMLSILDIIIEKSNFIYKHL